MKIPITSVLIIVLAFFNCSFGQLDLETASEKRLESAIKYFRSFHKGDLNKVYSYLSKDCTVQYRNQEPRKAKEFFENTKEVISNLKFEEKGAYTSEKNKTVVLHFTFQNLKPSTNENAKIIEAIDLITFNSNNKITKIKVISNE